MSSLKHKLQAVKKVCAKRPTLKEVRTAWRKYLFRMPTVNYAIDMDFIGWNRLPDGVFFPPLNWIVMRYGKQQKLRTLIHELIHAFISWLPPCRNTVSFHEFFHRIWFLSLIKFVKIEENDNIKLRNILIRIAKKKSVGEK